MNRALRIAVLAGGAAFVLRAGTARAAPATLTTTSGAGAADCPAAAGLAAIVNDGIGRTAVVPAAAAPPSPMQVAVSFERAGKSYAATVRIGGANGGTRKLANQGPGCAALANAVGVLLVVVLDANPTASTDDGAAPGSPAPSRTAAPTGARQTTADLGVGGGVAEGLVGGWSPTVGMGGTLTYGRWAARLGGIWLPSKSNDFGPGRVEVALAIARFGLCVSTRDDRSQVMLGFCLQQQVGWMRGRGVDYTDNHETNRLWLAAGGAIVAGGPLGRSFGWEADVGAVLPFREQRFTVGNLGTAYRSEPAAFMTTLTFTTRLW